MDNRLHPPGSSKDPGYLPLTEEALQHSLVDRFEYIAAYFPDQIAVRSGEQSLTYRQLNEASNRLAHAIIRLRGTQSEPVAFILEHGAAAIIAMLGIMKAGKAYVPVDPFYPPAWMTQILDDTHAELVLTNYQNLPLTMTSLVNPGHVTVLNLDTLEENLPTENTRVQTCLLRRWLISCIPPVPPARRRAPSTLTWMSCTMPSPWGVTCSSQQNDRFALFITLGFEASRFSLTGALMNGGTLCLYDIRSLGLGGLAEWIVQEQISVLLSTPSTFRHMFNLVAEDFLFSSVHKIVLGGESVTSQDVALFRSHFPKDCVLVNTLGMTETGVIARMKIDHQSVLQGLSVPAGFTVGDKKIVLVDESGQPVQTRRGGGNPGQKPLSLSGILAPAFADCREILNRSGR